MNDGDFLEQHLRTSSPSISFSKTVKKKNKKCCQASIKVIAFELNGWVVCIYKMYNNFSTYYLI